MSADPAPPDGPPLDGPAREAEIMRRRRGRNRAVLAVLFLFALLLYGLAMVRLGG